MKIFYKLEEKFREEVIQKLSYYLCPTGFQIENWLQIFTILTVFHSKIRKKMLYEVKRRWYVQVNKPTKQILNSWTFGYHLVWFVVGLCPVGRGSLRAVMEETLRHFAYWPKKHIMKASSALSAHSTIILLKASMKSLRSLWGRRHTHFSVFSMFCSVSY